MKNNMKCFWYLLFLFSITNITCKESSNSQTVVVSNDSIGVKDLPIINSSNEINWSSIPVQTLPFSYPTKPLLIASSSADDFFTSSNLPKDHRELERLFSPLTFLHHREYQYGHPYKEKGFFYKRLPDIGAYRLLLFAYMDLVTDYKEPTIELQIFDSKNLLVDKMIVVDGTSYECSWTRFFNLTKDNTITITDREMCANLEASPGSPPLHEKIITFLYKIKGDGKIVRYFKEIEKEVREYLSDFNQTSKDKYVSKGRVKNHYKQGFWEEVAPDMYKLDENGPYTNLIKAFGYYKDGEKDGEWLYYRIDENNDYLGSPRLAQRYKEGKLVEKTSESDAMESYTLIKRLDSLRNK